MPTLPLASGRVNDTWLDRDDFHSYVDNTKWTLFGNTNSTVTVTDSAGGIVTLSPVDATDNWQVGLKGTCEAFLFGEKTPFRLTGRLKFTEVATNAANVAFGCTNAAAVSLLVDNGAGPKTTGDYACIYKVDGNTYWFAKTLLNGTSYGNTNTGITAGGSYQTLDIQFTDKAGTGSGVVQYRINDQLVATHNLTTYTSATEMEPFFTVKQGSAAAQTLLVDTFDAEGVCQA